MKSYGDLTVEAEEQRAEIEWLNAKINRLINRGIEDMKFEIETLNERLKLLQDAAQPFITPTHQYVHVIVDTPELHTALFGEVES